MKVIYVVERKFYGETVQLGFSASKKEAKKYIASIPADDCWITTYKVNNKFQKFPEE